MALAYLLDPCLQHQNRAGVNNVAGWFEVFEYDTDDRATVYTDFEGTLAPAHIGIDNNGRCVMIVDSSKAYRVEMHLPNGDLVYTQSPVWTVVSGGGVVSNKVEVESTDGSIAVDKTVVGNVTTYDLSANVEDGTDLLEWIRCDGGTAQAGSDIVKPTYSAGTMLVGSTGVQVKANSYYHVTAHLRATKSDVDAYYDNVYVLFSLGNEPVTRQSVIIDYSMGLSQDFEVSTDVKVNADSELNLSIIGASNAGDVELLNMEMHRIYSGTPVIPGGVQRTLIAGANITLEHTTAGDIISSTGGGGGGGGTVPLSDLSGLRYSQGNTPVNRLSLQYGDRLGVYGYMGVKCDPSFVWNEGSVLHTRINLDSAWFGDPSWSYVYPLWYNVADPSKYICATNKNFYALHDNGMVTDPVADTTYQVVDVVVNSSDLTWSQPGIISTLGELSTSDWAFTYVSYGTSGRFPTGEDGVSWSENCVRGMFAGFISDGKMYAYLKQAGGINTSVDGLYVDPNYFQKKLTAGSGITIDGNTIDVKVQYIQEGYAEGYIETSGITTLSFTRLSDSLDTYVDPTCAYLLRVTLGGASQSGLGELVYGSNPSISLEKWQYVNDFQYTYVSSAIPQLSGMDISPRPSLNLNVSFLGESANRIYIVKPPEPIPGIYGEGEFLQLKLRDVTCDMASTLKMKAQLFKITPTQYVWQWPYY